MTKKALSGLGKMRVVRTFALFERNKVVRSVSVCRVVEKLETG